jgi:hypothetical protein
MVSTLPLPRPYALRPVIVAENLEVLQGPAEGLVKLAQRLCWSDPDPDRAYDLSDTDDVAELYENVLFAARSVEDLAEYVNGGLLARIWPEMAPDRGVQRAWEAAHPMLALAPAA